MNTRIRFKYNFHAVGQGLFATGHLLEQKRQFTWVLDCGSARTMPATYLKREVAHFVTEMRGGRIGMFCLSHFDEDHIKGAGELLSSHLVDVLVMPYFPLVERIQIALGTSDISDEYLDFLIDPVGYMFEAADGELREIVLIAGGGPPEESQRDAPQDLPAPPSDESWKLRYPDTEIPQSSADQSIQGASAASQGKSVRVFTHQKPFTVGVWEFMFFNEHIPGKNAPALERKVAEIILKHPRKDGAFDGKELLAELKALYVLTFPGGAAQNRISLIVYAGPIDRQLLEYVGVWGSLAPAWLPEDYFPRHEWIVSSSPERKASIGYFGDFPLTKPERVTTVQNHFSLHRWNRLQVVQIPHHGSIHSWYAGASKEFHHGISVISSARHSKDHPSQIVIDDLDKYGVVLVNELQRAEFNGRIEC